MSRNDRTLAYLVAFVALALATLIASATPLAGYALVMAFLAVVLLGMVLYVRGDNA